MVFNASFNNILVISWRSFLFLEKTGILYTRVEISSNNGTTKIAGSSDDGKQ
jgi:hypothetical protein